MYDLLKKITRPQKNYVDHTFSSAGIVRYHKYCRDSSGAGGKVKRITRQVFRVATRQDFRVTSRFQHVSTNEESRRFIFYQTDAYLHFYQ